ncbi:hypothetical protein EHQ79_14760 [Leptospira jelokensis]|nr:hypothetical protein EHQ79_14760 [Leptospira jelokensis]
MNGSLEKYFVIMSSIGIQEVTNFIGNHSLLIAKYSLFLNLLIYFLMNGAQIFETLVFVPRWASGQEPNLGILNYFRVFIFIGISILMIPLVLKII